MAPGAVLVAYDAQITPATSGCGDPIAGDLVVGDLYDGSTGGSLAEAHDSHDARVFNFSWGTAGNGYSGNAEDIDDQYAIIVEQQYYVGHSYNALEAVLGCVPYEGGTVVFYTSRVFTCQVTGFASGIARGIGRKQIMSSVAEELERLRTALEAT